jgi:hypothetical protein
MRIKATENRWLQICWSRDFAVDSDGKTRTVSWYRPAKNEGIIHSDYVH